MTYPELMTELQQYYGKYPNKPDTASYVFQYLKRDIDESKTSKLFRYLTYSHPVAWGAPDIAAIETAIVNALKNTKGAIDPHKSPGDTETKREILTPEEHDQGIIELNSRGGLGKIFADMREKGASRRDKALGGPWIPNGDNEAG